MAQKANRSARTVSMQATLQPAQAVHVLNDRVKRISKINIEIADWIQVGARPSPRHIDSTHHASHKKPCSHLRSFTLRPS
jgi:hypothetical protein